MNTSRSDRLKTRDRLAKIDRFMMYNYTRHDAELLADAELEAEEVKAAEESNAEGQ